MSLEYLVVISILEYFYKIGDVLRVHGRVWCRAEFLSDAQSIYGDGFISLEMALPT